MTKYCPPSFLIALLAISSLALFLYAPFLTNGLVFDDANLFSSLAVYQFAQIPFDWHSRTFPYFTLGFTQVVFDGIEAHRITSLFLHGCCAWMIFVLTRTLLERVAPAKHCNADKLSWNAATTLALLGALVFLLNPVAVYGAGYLVQRTILFATLFSLLSLWYFQRAFAENRTTDVIGAALLYSAAVFSKEHAIMLPLAALAFIPLYDADKTISIRRAALYLALCAPAAITVLLAKKSLVVSGYEPDIGTLIPLIDGIWLLQFQWGLWLASLLMQMSFFFDYLAYWIFPDVRSMSIDMRIEFANLWATWWFIPKALLFLVCPLIGVHLLRRRNAAAIFGCGLLYCWVLFITELVSIRFQEPFVLYRSYLWAPGYVLMIVAVLRPVPIKWVIVGAIPVFSVYFWLAQERLASLENEGTVWKDAAIKLESKAVVGSGRIFYNRGRQYLKEKRFSEAVEDFSHAIAQNPKAYYAFYHRGTAYYALSEYSKARIDLDHALELNKEFGPIQYSRGLLFERLGCDELAIRAYSDSLRLGVAVASLKLKHFERKGTLSGSTPPKFPASQCSV